MSICPVIDAFVRFRRKRSERGEETNETIIVRNLTKQRIEELKQITQSERETIAKLKRDFELIKNNKMSDKRIQEILKEIKDKEEKEKQMEIEHKKWLEEREVKIAQMSRKGSFLARKVTPSASTTPVAPVSQAAQGLNTSVVDSEAKSPINEPLKVEVDSESNVVQTPQPNQTTESKLSIALTSPSTSPLLTSLLQSPTPSSPNILSPTKTGLSVTPINRTKLPLASPVTPITRRPSIHSTPEKVSDVKANESIESPVNAVNPNASPTASEQTKAAIDSPKLSKLLETQDSKAKTNANESQSSSNVLTSESNNAEAVVEITDHSTSNSSSAHSETESQTQNSTSLKRSDDVTKPDESNERTLRSVDKTSKSKSDDKIDELKDERDLDQMTDNGSNDTIESVSIKQEVMDISVEEDKQEKEMEKINVKEEPIDTMEDDSNQKTPSNKTNKRNRKTPNPISITPTAMRRSRRVALKDQKSATDDSTEMSDQSAANTPQAVKTRGSVDDTTETSMSEESMDARSVAPMASVDTVPNSPASVRTEDMNFDSKEYRTWKKAIMVNWRLISSHKNASLFSHPVTEAEAKGYEDIVHLPIDLNTIKKRVENGQIRTTVEYQRDILQMFQNAIMFNNADHDVHKMAVEMQRDTINSIEEFIETQKHDNQSNESKLRARERRSNVSALVANEVSLRPTLLTLTIALSVALRPRSRVGARVGAPPLTPIPTLPVLISLRSKRRKTKHFMTFRLIV